MAISLHKPTIGFNRMPVKSSYPKLHSIKMKSGVHGPSLSFHPNAAYMRVKPDDVLYGAHLAELSEIVIVGYDYSGGEYMAMSTANTERASYMLQRGTLALLRDSDYLEE